MGDSGDEFRGPLPPPRRRGRPGREGEAGPGRAARSPFPPRAGRRRRRPPRSPPALLLQEPEGARRGLAEAAAALLGEEAGGGLVPPGTPALPASRLREAARPRARLWERSALAEAPWPAAGLGASRTPPGDHRRDAAALQDLRDLAAEGLPPPRRHPQPEQEQMPRDLQDAFIHQQPPPGSCFCKRFQHNSLAAAFKEMVNNPHLSDVQFQVDSGELIYAHKFVLYARCPQLLQFVRNRQNV